MMEYIIAAVVLAVAVGAYFYMKREEKKEPEAEKWPWEQPKPKRPNEPPPQPEVVEGIGTPTLSEKVDVVDVSAEKERISLLVTGKADFYLTNPEQYEKMAKYANPDYPPFNETTWLMTGMYGRDMRPSYETIEAMKAGRYSNDPNRPFKS